MLKRDCALEKVPGEKIHLNLWVPLPFMKSPGSFSADDWAGWKRNTVREVKSRMGGESLRNVGCSQERKSWKIGDFCLFIK
jgi:hypothetical protein